MKVLGYTAAHEWSAFAIREMDRPVPSCGPNDVLVQVKASAFNPVDTKVRRTRSASNDKPVILGWDVAGVIETVGSEVSTFKAGDEVYYSGEFLRDGAYAEKQVVDHRIIAKKPTSLSFAQAAALPLTSLTAYEALLEKIPPLRQRPHDVLIVGGAGGVGSMAIQWLKALTPARVIATAARPETQAWCKKMGADIVIDHAQDLVASLKHYGIHEVDVVFATTQTQRYLPALPGLLRALGHFCLIDDPGVVDVAPFKRKSISIHWEFMFAKTLFGIDPPSQGAVLRELASLVDGRRIQSTANLVQQGLEIEHVREAHALLEGGRAVGKIVMSL